MMTWAALFYGYFLCAIVLDHAHLVCPIALGWSNRGFRRHMLAQPRMYLLPAFCVGLSAIIGLGSHSTREPTFRMLALVYIWWNAWHFGSQHFGIASLLGWCSGPRWLRRAALILPTMTLMLAPMGSIALVIAGEVISFLHWTTDIGLSAMVRRGFMFLAAVMCIGLIGFAWKVVTTDPHFCGIAPACTAVWSIPALLGLRYGLGFWHFLMSRWVWAGEGRKLIGATQ